MRGQLVVESTVDRGEDTWLVRGQLVGENTVCRGEYIW